MLGKEAQWCLELLGNFSMQVYLSWEGAGGICSGWKTGGNPNLEAWKDLHRDANFSFFFFVITAGSKKKKKEEGFFCLLYGYPQNVEKITFFISQKIPDGCRMKPAPLHTQEGQECLCL